MPQHDAPSGTMVRERACECAARNRVILLSSRSIGLKESHSFELDAVQACRHTRTSRIVSVI